MGYDVPYKLRPHTSEATRRTLGATERRSEIDLPEGRRCPGTSFAVVGSVCGVRRQLISLEPPAADTPPYAHAVPSDLAALNDPVPPAEERSSGEAEGVASM